VVYLIGILQEDKGEVMERKRSGLRYPYLSVKTQTENSFGGSQSWSNRRILRKYGCGVVGMADVLLYLGLHREDCETDLFYGILREDGYLSYPRYDRFVRKIWRRFLPVIPGVGIPGFFIPMAMNRYFRRYRIPLRAGWCFRSGQLLSRVETMLQQDIPVILAIGPNFPFLWRRKKLTLYRLENGEYFPALETSAHFVVVTGIVGEFLQISSWGKEYYISWPEYQKYMKKNSSPVASNICRVQEKRKKRKES